ncbi:MAG: AmmeMemoRadiSam system protein A [Dehalococcoidia bacterium]|nr:AmmeMemoRadiSam system protein A [Dehalococcoidia bacterium]
MEPTSEPKKLHPLAQLAKDTVETYVKSGYMVTPRELTPEMKERAGVFVSIKKSGMLRGCIGTFEPRQPNVAEEIINNAVSSATQDPRFPAVIPAELPYLTYSVDVLTKPEPVENASQLDSKKYGVIVESGRRKGLLLPDLEGVDTVEEQIDICRQKAGIPHQEPVNLYRFQVKRYSAI